MPSALAHQAVEVGAAVGGEFSLRERVAGEHAIATSYMPLGRAAEEAEAAAYTFAEDLWDLKGTVFEGCLFFI